MASVESELVGLTAVQDLAKKTLSPAAAIVDAVATAELPTMSSGDSNDSIAAHRNQNHVEIQF
eukprot:COSAG05_NODE_3211_length_2240_cov_2.765530_2_plen_63_part_00